MLLCEAALPACTAERDVVGGYIDGRSAAGAPAHPAVPLARPVGGEPGGPAGVRAGGTPLLLASPAHLLFPFTTPGTLRVTTLALLNAGTGILRIERLELTGDEAFRVRLAGDSRTGLRGGGPALEPARPLEIKPGASLRLLVDFRPTTVAAAEAVLRARSNDPSRERQLAVLIRGNLESPCLSLSPADRLDFGHVDVGSCRTRLVDAAACGTAPVVITAVGFTDLVPDGPFSVSWGSGGASPAWIDGALKAGTGDSIVLQPGAKLAIAVTYCPPSLTPQGRDEATLGVQSSAPGPHALPCVGVPVQPACPTAVAGVAPGDIATVGAMTRLTSVASSATGGEIVSWHWTLQAPPLSGAALWPSGAVPDPALTFDVAGSYTACLEVWDGAGVKSCHPGCITLHATDPAAYDASPIW